MHKSVYSTGMTLYAPFIKSLREQRKLSQTELAEKINISRSSYVALEKGTKELTLSEADTLARFFGITVDELMSASMPDYEKYVQMIFAFLRKAKEANTKVRKTKLAKLLYFADFAFYYLHSVSMSGMKYKKIDYGPVPDAYFRVFEELEDKAQINVQTEQHDDGKNMYCITENIVSERTKLDLLSEEETTLIGKIWDKWKNANTQEIVQYTHEQSPYKKTEYGQVIPYELIKEEQLEYIF